MIDETWQQFLVRNYPQLFTRTFKGLPFSPGRPVCPDGWSETVTRMVQRVSDAARSYPVWFCRISEEHGRLYAYWKADAEIPKHVERAIEEAIELGEARSASTCANCGAEGRLFCSGGLMLTACARHAYGEPVPISSELENLHFVRGFSGGELHFIACRRYNWQRDCFVDVTPN